MTSMHCEYKLKKTLKVLLHELRNYNIVILRYREQSTTPYARFQKRMWHFLFVIAQVKCVGTRGHASTIHNHALFGYYFSVFTEGRMNEIVS